MSSIEIKLIGITDLNTDCIVNAANRHLAQGSGVCGAVFNAAGPREMQAACDEIGVTVPVTDSPECTGSQV